MNEADITTRLRLFIETQFPLARKREIEADSPLLTSGIIDSMGTMDLVAFMESEFDFVLSDEEMLADNFETLQKMTDFVHCKLAPSLSVLTEKK